MKLERYYPIAIVLISFALLSIRLFQSPLTIVGNDIQLEYRSYQLFVNHHVWINDIPLIGRCLGVSVLPGLIETAIGTANTLYDPFVYKLIFVIISAFTPLLVYYVSRHYFSSLQSLFCALFFSVQISYLATAISPRSNLALFFFALAVFFFLRLPTHRNIIGFGLSLALLPFCHYTTACVAVAVFSVFCGVSLITRTATRATVAQKYAPVILVVGIITFTWLDTSSIVRMSSAGIHDAGLLGIEALSPLPAVSESTVTRSGVLVTKNAMLGMLFGQGVTSIRQWVNLTALWLSFLLTAIGVIGLVWRRTVLGWLGLISATLLVAFLVVPYLSVWYSPLRLFAQCAVILSPCMMYGSLLVGRWLHVPSYIAFLVTALPIGFFNVVAATHPFPT